MPSSFVRVLVLTGCLGLLPLAFSLNYRVPAEAAPKLPEVRLAVLLVFDQMRGDYLSRWDGLFGEDGFHRLEKDGAWFQNCHYPYSYTVTAAGHASISTGTCGDRHGIVANEWYDRGAGSIVESITSSRYTRVPPSPVKPDGKTPESKKTPGVSPERLLQPTVADALKKATGGRGKVVALSLKDRSAVMPGGKRPDACYWFDAPTGEFVTSSYYRGPHSWAMEFNRDKVVDRWLGKNWTRLRPELDYERFSGPDDVVGEGIGYSFKDEKKVISFAQGRTFPHPMDAPGVPRNIYYSALTNSPFGNEILLELAKRAIDRERLGRGTDPDLLTLSFSSNDLIGHVWGPDSQEVLDVTLRSDQIVRELMNHLDAKVGKGHYVLLMTADHGVCPLPEVNRSRGDKTAQRVPPTLLKEDAAEFLNDHYGVKKSKVVWFESSPGAWVYLNRAALASRGLSTTEVESVLAGWLGKQEGIRKAYTRTQLMGPDDALDADGRMLKRSFYPDRSGDVVVVVKPFSLIATPIAGSGTTHGSPHDYDTHVPLLVYGPGVHSGKRTERVTPLAAAAILSAALGIAPPDGAEAPVPPGLFEATKR